MYKSAMQLLLKLCYCLCIVLSVPILSYGKDWRGIIPMRSTRADVEALLGEPAPPTEYRPYSKRFSIYLLDDGEVEFVFAEAEGKVHDCVKNVPAGTVLLIEIRPKKELTLRDLSIDETKFRKFDPSDPPNIGYQAYINEQEGLIVRTYENKVDKIVYIASAADKGRCPDYYADSETMVKVFPCRFGPVKFDEFGNLSAKDENARLDNFAIQLEHMSDTVGYIIVYAGRRAGVGEAYTRSKRAKDYLEGHRAMMGRVVAIDGGYREDFTMELFIGLREEGPPTASPTVDSSEVQIINDQAKPRKRRPVRP